MVNAAHEVDYEALHAHAAELSRHATTIGHAHNAGDSIKNGRNAYGKLFQFLPDLLGVSEDLFLSTATTVQKAAEGTAKRVKKAADRYERTDHGNKSMVKKLHVEPRWR